MIKRIAYFLHLIDRDNRLNLADIAFCVIMVKVAYAPQIDWTALVTLAVVCLNMIHKRKTNASVDINGLQSAIQQQSDTLKGIADKVSGVLK